MTLDLGELLLNRGYVHLEPLALEHTKQLSDAAGEAPSLYDYNNCPIGVDGAKSYIEIALSQKEAGTRYPFVIYYQGKVAGTTSYADYQPWKWQKGNPNQRTQTPDALEIGYTWLSKSAIRTTCNTSVKYLLLRHAFEEFGVLRVFLQTDERNAISREAIERLGAKLEGIRRAHKVAADGQVRSSAQYSILADEWPAIQKVLEARLASEL